MKNNVISILMILCALSLAGLAALTVWAEGKQYRDLNLVVPDGYGIPAYDLKKIEKTSAEDALITYELKRTASAKGVVASQSVTLIGTNTSYCRMLGLQELEGSFFTNEAWQAGSRYAVLNEQAAFQLFGGSGITGNTVVLDGERYLVTGIVRDGSKKKPVVYIPSSILTEFPQVLMVQTDGGAGEIRESLRELGVYDSNSRVISLFAVSRSFGRQTAAAVIIGSSAILLFFAYGRLKVVGLYYRELNGRSQTMYARQLLVTGKRQLRRMALHSAAAVLSIITSLFLWRRLLLMILEYMDVMRDFKYLSDYFFTERVQWLTRYFYCGPVLFFVFVIVLVMAVVVAAGRTAMQ